MTNEQRTPFKVGEIYKTRGGEERRVVYIDDQPNKTEYPILSVCVSGILEPFTHTICGKFSKDHTTKIDLLPPTPLEPEQRTVWLTVHKHFSLAHDSKHDADLCTNTKQGNSIPVNLERGEDSNWRVVSELTPKQAAAEEMYEALVMIKTNVDLRDYRGIIEPTIAKAIAKAEGRS